MSNITIAAMTIVVDDRNLEPLRDDDDHEDTNEEVSSRDTGRRSRTLRLTPSQYRRFAEDTKAVGLSLNVSTYEHMGCWGTYSPWALRLVTDASVETPQFGERAMINIASSVDPDSVRAVAPRRPELDWSVLEDHEIYPFVVQHEIGHRQDNFDTIFASFSIRDPEVFRLCQRRIGFANEVLADRYAWRQIRPGEPIPLSAIGKRMEGKIAETLAWLEQHCKKLAPCRPERKMAPGAYRDVPDYMLATPERAAFIGPKVNRRLLEERCAYYKRYNEDCPRNPLF